ncbi:MAG: Uma2 family endonuclease [Planctomycetes bacterium]|nr:Uma2 family endonuclease [Planctomycetota bacterium]
MEVVSPGVQNRERDLDVKRHEYARAGIAEYWIVDLEQHSITVLTLDGNAYRTAGEYGITQTAPSVLLPDFSVEVRAAFDAGEVAE